jgi:hypothetical protein
MMAWVRVAVWICMVVHPSVSTSMSRCHGFGIAFESDTLQMDADRDIRGGHWSHALGALVSLRSPLLW